jgi:hypothetical protein
MSQPRDFNEPRRARSESERRFLLGPYTFTRRATAAPELLLRFQTAGEDGDDRNVIQIFDETVEALIDPAALVTETGEEVESLVAWRTMRTEGDENGVIGMEDIEGIVEFVVSGLTERPTGEPSDSSDGSPTPATGTSLTDTSASPEVQALTGSMPAAS